MNITKFFFCVVVGVVALVVQNAQSQELSVGNLYQNSTGYQNANFDYGNAAAGNEVILAGSSLSDMVNGFSFQFDFSGTGTPSGFETADLSFYKNDGSPVPAVGGYASPSTLLYDSGPFSLGAYTSGSTFTFDQTALGGGVLVPNIFTWIVTFSGLTSGENAGLAIYSPPTVGENYQDAWYNDGTDGWQLQTTDPELAGDPALEFGAVVTSVPEPSCLWIVNLAFGAGFCWMNRGIRRQRSA